MNETQLKRLQSDGKIQNFSVQKRDKVYKDSNTKPRKDLPVVPAKTSEEKSWLEWNLLYWCNERSLNLAMEYQFDPRRKWRCDFAIPSLRIIIEYEGLMSAKSRHTTITGYTGDVEKYNAAAKQGWLVLRYTALNYRNAIQDLKEIIK